MKGHTELGCTRHPAGSRAVGTLLDRLPHAPAPNRIRHLMHLVLDVRPLQNRCAEEAAKSREVENLGYEDVLAVWDVYGGEPPEDGDAVGDEAEVYEVGLGA